MTELSDYRRMVEGPMVKRYEERIANLITEIERLRALSSSPQPSEGEVERQERLAEVERKYRGGTGPFEIAPADYFYLLEVAMSPRPQPGMISADKEAINTIRMEAGTGDALSEYVRGYDVGKKVAADDLIAFLAMWATTYQRDYGLDGLHPIHFDLLEKYGARMVDFKRATIPEPPKE